VKIDTFINITAVLTVVMFISCPYSLFVLKVQLNTNQPWVCETDH